MPSIFSRIVAGEIPAYKVAEDEKHLAFLDAFPLKKGHVLVIPKLETDYLFDLDSDAYNELMNFSGQVARALKKSVTCQRISMHVIGLEVPHAHIHLIPINTPNDCNFANEKLKLTEEEFKEIAAQIALNIITE